MTLFTRHVLVAKRIEVFVNKCLRRFFTHPWFDRVTNQRLLHQTGSMHIACSPTAPSHAIWACGTLPRSRPCIPDYFRKKQVDMEEAEGTSTELVAKESWWLLLIGTLDGVGGTACWVSRRSPREWRRRVCKTTRQPVYAPVDWFIDYYPFYYSSDTLFTWTVHLKPTEMFVTAPLIG